MNINFKLIQAFVAVAQQGSFRKAAELTSRTTSAVSMQVRQLEDQVGTPLFERTTRRVELTLEGRHLLERAHRAMTDIDQGLREIGDSVRLRQGAVSVACSPTVAATLLPPVLASFAGEFPNVLVRVREQGAQAILASVSAHEVDFGLGPTADHASDFQFHALMRDELCALVPIAHRLARRRRLAIDHLEGVPLVMFSNFAAMRRVIENAAMEANVTLSVQYEFQQMQTVVAMASAGLGVGISTRLAVSTLGSLLDKLHVVSIGTPPLSREISVITLRGGALTPMASELFKRLRAAVA